MNHPFVSRYLDTSELSHKSTKSHQTYSERTARWVVVQPPLRFGKINQSDSGATCGRK